MLSLTGIYDIAVVYSLFVIIKKSGSRLGMSSRGSVSFCFVLSHIHLNRIYRDGKKYEAIFSEAKDNSQLTKSAGHRRPVPRASATDLIMGNLHFLGIKEEMGQALSAESPVVGPRINRDRACLPQTAESGNCQAPRTNH